jgi:hypothetical protein
VLEREEEEVRAAYRTTITSPCATFLRHASTQATAKSPPLAESLPLCRTPLPIFHYARLQPFLDQADEPFVSDPMPHELFQVIMPDFVEK